MRKFLLGIILGTFIGISLWNIGKLHFSVELNPTYSDIRQLEEKGIIIENHYKGVVFNLYKLRDWDAGSVVKLELLYDKATQVLNVKGE